MGRHRAAAQTTRHWLVELWRGAIDLALPPSCPQCAVPVRACDALCEPCNRLLTRIPEDTCALCQAAWVESGLCAVCEFAASPLAACVAAFSFDGEARAWIGRYKYPRPGLAGLDPAPRVVVDALVRAAAGRVPGPLPAVVIPVPLHPSRLRSRGFNPAAKLARSLAREYDLACDPVALRRTRATESQTGLDRAARRRNVRGAFRTRRGWRAPERVWLLDDVVTTGSTLTECALALRRAGARNVVGICAARTLTRDDPTGRSR